MGILVWAVLVASLLGSMHCVGMCGPLALFATGFQSQQSWGQRAFYITLYHVGRLTSYAMAGALAGMIGNLVDYGADLLGWQLLTARLVGSLMILWGCWQLFGLVKTRTGSAAGLEPKWVGKIVQRIRPYVMVLPAADRSFVIGLLTALLPCGWLYLFAMVAAGTADPLSGAAVMAAFWVGTTPALTALVAGAGFFLKRIPGTIPVLTAILLITTGSFTLAGRGISDATGYLTIDKQLKQDPGNFDQTQLPCCQPRGNGPQAGTS